MKRCWTNDGEINIDEISTTFYQYFEILASQLF